MVRQVRLSNEKGGSWRNGLSNIASQAIYAIMM